MLSRNWYSKKGLISDGKNIQMTLDTNDHTRFRANAAIKKKEHLKDFSNVILSVNNL